MRMSRVQLLSPAPLQNGKPNAQMAELVDALGSGPSGSNPLEVRVLFWAPVFKDNPFFKKGFIVSALYGKDFKTCQYPSLSFAYASGKDNCSIACTNHWPDSRFGNFSALTIPVLFAARRRRFLFSSLNGYYSTNRSLFGFSAHAFFLPSNAFATFSNFR